MLSSVHVRPSLIQAQGSHSQRPQQSPAPKMIPALAFKGNENSPPPSDTDALIQAGAALVKQLFGEDAGNQFLTLANAVKGQLAPAKPPEVKTESAQPPAPVSGDATLDMIYNNINSGNFKQTSVWRNWSQNSGDFNGSNGNFSTVINGEERSFEVKYHYNIHRSGIGYSLTESTQGRPESQRVSIQNQESGIAQQIHNALKAKVGHINKLPLTADVTAQNAIDQEITNLLSPILSGVSSGPVQYLKSYEDIRYNDRSFDARHDVSIPVNGQAQTLHFVDNQALLDSSEGFTLTQHEDKAQNRPYMYITLVHDRITLNKGDYPYQTLESDNSQLVGQLNDMFSAIRRGVAAR